MELAATRNPGGRGHSKAVRMRALALIKAGWSNKRTSEIMAKEGTPVSTSTVQRWRNPDTHEKEIARASRSAARKRAAAPRTPATNYSPEFKVARMRELYERGVKLREIGQVSAVWFGEELTPAAVRHRIGLNMKIRVAA